MGAYVKLSFEENEKARCKSKKRFPCSVFAKEAAERLGEKFKMSRKEPYLCPWCKYWHLKSVGGVKK